MLLNQVVILIKKALFETDQKAWQFGYSQNSPNSDLAFKIIVMVKKLPDQNSIGRL